MVETDSMIELNYQPHKDAIKTAVTLEDMLKKYKRERSRKKMMPHYEKMLEEVAQLAEPQIAYQFFGSDIVEQVDAHVPKEMQAVIFAVCTLGYAIDEYYEQLAVDEMAMAAILDEISLAWIVVLTRQFHRVVRAQGVEIGLKVGPAYRPGVGNIPIELQATVFEHLQTAEIGVTLDEFMVMRPARSTSLVIPILR